MDGSKDTGVEINSQGTRHLGAAVGTDGFKKYFIERKVELWVEAVKKLAEIAKTEPHAAYSAFTHALQCQWTFLSRAMPGIAEQFKPLEFTIRTIFLKTLLNKDVNDNEREILALPARLGGLGIPNPAESTHIAHENSRFISAPLVKLILLQETEIETRDILDETKMLRYIVDKNAEETIKQELLLY